MNDRISFSRFVGLSLEAQVPDHSVICRFRGILTKSNAYEKLFQEINEQLTNHGILVRTGVIVDASITDSPRKPKGKREYEIVEDRCEVQAEDVPVKVVKKIESHIDIEARWIKKMGRYRFGYKQHTAVDENGLILGIVTTPANESDTVHLRDVLDKIVLEPRASVKADKGYKSASNDELIKSRGLRNRVMFKDVRGREITHWQKQMNRLISKTRFKVERTFGAMRRWFNSGTARYVGRAKMHTQHLMEAMAHNLYRAPRIVISITEK